MSGYFIAGTDTAVGKTRVTAGLIAGFTTLGIRTAGMKPVVCGLISDRSGDFNEDVDIITTYSGQDPHDTSICPYVFSEPISPNIAALKSGRSIDIGVIRDEFTSISGKYPLTIVEGTGGWLAPIGPTQTMADIAVALGLPVLLVVGLRLGCLNHALLSYDAIKRSGLPWAGWIANAIDAEFAEPAANLATLTARLGAAPLAVLPHSGSLRTALAPLERAAATLRRRLPGELRVEL